MTPFQFVRDVYSSASSAFWWLCCFFFFFWRWLVDPVACLSDALRVFFLCELCLQAAMFLLCLFTLSVVCCDGDIRKYNKGSYRSGQRLPFHEEESRRSPNVGAHISEMSIHIRTFPFPRTITNKHFDSLRRDSFAKRAIFVFCFPSGPLKSEQRRTSRGIVDGNQRLPQ